MGELEDLKAEVAKGKAEMEQMKLDHKKQATDLEIEVNKKLETATKEDKQKIYAEAIEHKVKDLKLTADQAESFNKLTEGLSEEQRFTRMDVYAKNIQVDPVDDKTKDKNNERILKYKNSKENELSDGDKEALDIIEKGKMEVI